MGLLRRAVNSLLGVPNTHRLPPVPIAIPVVSMSPRRGSREVLRAHREDAWLQAVGNTVATPRWRVYKPVTQKGFGLKLRLKSLTPNDRHKVLKTAVERRDWVELEDHELLRILENPHPKNTDRAYRKVSQLQVDLAGEAFWLLRRTESGRVVGYEVIPPHAVLMTPTAEQPFFFFITYNLFSGAVHQDDVLWFKDLDPANPDDRGVGMGLAT